MKKLTPEDIAECKKLAESVAIKSFVDMINFAESNSNGRKLSSHELIDDIFTDYGGFSELATYHLCKNGFMDSPYIYSGNAHEKLLCFKVFESAYGEKVTDLIKDKFRTYINVPFTEKEEAKSLGARWDKTSKRWFIPEGINVSTFSKWVIQDKPGVKLPIDLVPSSAWFSNLRSEISSEEWSLVKKATYVAAKYRCECCGGRGPNHPVECHERWSYDMTTSIQKLIGTVALCPSCHEATHYGFARVRGREKEARSQLMLVNEWSESQLDFHVCEKMEEWKERSFVKWFLDARWLIDFVPLSESTLYKIMEHANGISNREISCFQNDICEKQMQNVLDVTAVSVMSIGGKNG